MTGLLVLASTPLWIPDLPWIRHWVAQQITLRTGLSCEIGHLRLLTPDGSARAEHVRFFGTATTSGAREGNHPANDQRQARLARAAASPGSAWRQLVIDGGSLVWQVRWAPRRRAPGR